MAKLSAVIISKNSQALIGDCIKSLSFCDEVIVIDSISSDRTSDIAKKMGAKVIEFAGGDFSEMRNFGLRSSSGDWLLYVDTDERVSPELARNIEGAINQKEFSAFKLLRKNFYFGEFEWPKIEKLERLFKRENLKGWYGKIHESPNYEGKIGILSGFLLHYTHRDLKSMVDKTIEWSDVESDLRIKANHPKMTWWRFPRVMLTSFLNSYVGQKGYKAGTAGLVESIYQSFSTFITYARLWEKQNK